MSTRWIGRVLGCGWMLGCADPAPTTGGTPTETADPGACGEVTSMDLAIGGRVEDQDQQPVAGATVILEERNWDPGAVHGQARTDAGGGFLLEGRGLPVVEGCWGTAVQFWLVGETAELWGDKPMNTQIIGAWNEGAPAIDLGAFPLVLE